MLVQQVRARREALWQACATADGLASWQADSVRGVVGPGQTLALAWKALGVELTLDVVELEPGEKILFRSGTSTLELEVADGLVTLTQEGIEGAGDLEGLASSWRVALALLAHAVERHPGRQRRTYWRARRVQTTAAAAFLLFTAPEGLTRWLGSGQVGPTGSAYEFELSDQSRMSGRVLACVHGHDVALSWEEAGEAALVLRTLPAAVTPEERIIALTCSTWEPVHLDPEAAARLDVAFDRLCRALASGGRA